MTNKFKEKIIAGEFVTSLEINPRKNGNLRAHFREIEACLPFIDAVNVTDCSMAVVRPASFVVAAAIQRRFGVYAIFNYTCQ